MRLSQYTVELQGIDSTIAAIERFAPDLKRELDKEVKGVVSKIVQEARDYLPFDVRPSGWSRQMKFAGLIGPLEKGKSRNSSFVTYDVAKAKAGIKSVSPTSRRGTTGFRNAYGVIQRDKAGAIFETAGRGSNESRERTRASMSTNPRASEQFIQTIEKYYGVLPTANHEGNDKGRALIKATDNNRKNAQGKIFSAIKSAESKAQSRMDANLSKREG
jgi:hypothetical protein